MDKSTLAHCLFLLRSSSQQESELIKLSTHYNGHIREASIKQLALLNTPTAIPALLVRINDWVPQVRQAADTALQQLATTENAATYIRYLPKIYHLKNCRRYNHQSFIQFFEDYISAPENRNHIIEAIEAPCSETASIALKICRHQNWLPKFDLISIGLQHPKDSVRLLATQYLADLHGKSLEQAIKIALKDHFPAVRRTALLIAQDVQPKWLDMTKYLFDAHSSIRDIAIYYLKNKNIDIKELYRPYFYSEDAKKLNISIWGMSALSNIDAIPDIQTQLQHPYPYIRKQAALALLNLQGSDSHSILLHYLNDPSPSVAKLIAHNFKKQKIRITASELLKIVKQPAAAHTILACRIIMHKANKWEQLIALYQLRSIKRDCHDIFDHEIYRWVPNYMVIPTKKQALALQKLIKKSDINPTAIPILQEHGILS